MSETHKRIYAMDDYDPVAFRRGVESDPVAHEHETYVVQQKLCSEITEETRHEWLLSLYTLQSVRSDNVLLMSIDDAHKIIAISRIRNRIERTTKPPHYNDAWNAEALVAHLIGLVSAAAATVATTQSLLEQCCAIPSTMASEAACAAVAEFCTSAAFQQHMLAPEHAGAWVRWLYRMRSCFASHKKCVWAVDAAIAAVHSRAGVLDDRAWIVGCLVTWASGGSSRKKPRVEQQYTGFAAACVRMAAGAALLCDRICKGAEDEDVAADMETCTAAFQGDPLLLFAQDRDDAADEHHALSMRWAALYALQEAVQLGIALQPAVQQMIRTHDVHPTDKMCITKRIQDAETIGMCMASYSHVVRSIEEQCIWIEVASSCRHIPPDLYRDHVERILSSACSSFAAQLLLRAAVAASIPFARLPVDTLLRDPRRLVAVTRLICQHVLNESVESVVAVAARIDADDDQRLQIVFAQYKQQWIRSDHRPHIADLARAADAGHIHRTYAYAMYFDATRDIPETCRERCTVCIRSCVPVRSTFQAWVIALCCFAMIKAGMTATDDEVLWIQSAVRELQMHRVCKEMHIFFSFALLVLRSDTHIELHDDDMHQSILHRICFLMAHNADYRAAVRRYYTVPHLSADSFEIPPDDTGPFSCMSYAIRLSVPPVSSALPPAS